MQSNNGLIASEGVIDDAAIPSLIKSSIKVTSSSGAAVSNIFGRMYDIAAQREYCMIDREDLTYTFGCPSPDVTNPVRINKRQNGMYKLSLPGTAPHEHAP
jgi:hypothetical protein